jgi:ferredoxin-NADP reductase
MDATAGTHELRVRSMSLEAEDVLSIVLEPVDGRELPEFEYGSHIDFIMRPDLIRQYSLCGEPSIRNQWTIAVLLEVESRGGSTYVHEVLRPGMTVTVAGPRSNFKLVDA